MVNNCAECENSMVRGKVVGEYVLKDGSRVNLCSFHATSRAERGEISDVVSGRRTAQLLRDSERMDTVYRG